ncbi:TetR/AcrR family transcriptional regulator [Chitinibacter sp. GC72]|uniref:TetR/AcrR family transcriptional regulator n=1 Tax=Chitinibacter sp. GC72 TaxID=1526917 RepID=UPI0012FC3DDD|nr:TetR/AcrR family transcriptional regulator [Chitinibacter sp. GC72]
MSANSADLPDIDKAELRRLQVLDAAAACFRLAGFHAASMASIAKAAGMSVGHIYHYFANKEAIISAIIDREQHKQLQVIHMLLRAENTIEALIEHAEQGLADSLDLSNSALNFEMIAEASRNPKVAEMLQASNRVLHEFGKDIITKARADLPALSEEDNNARCDLIISLFDGLSMRAISNPRLNTQAVLPALQRTIVQIVRS